MNKLILTSFNQAGAKGPEDKIYKDWEKVTVPTPGMMLFIFSKEEKDQTRVSNINTVMQSFNYDKDLKFNEWNNASIKNMTKTESLNVDRLKELKKMYNEITIHFLENLHKATWLSFGEDGGKYIRSTIDFEDIYEPLRAAMDALKIVLTDIINDKYDYKYVKAETEAAVKQNSLNNEIQIGKLSSNKKRKHKD